MVLGLFLRSCTHLTLLDLDEGSCFGCFGCAFTFNAFRPSVWNECSLLLVQLDPCRGVEILELRGTAIWLVVEMTDWSLGVWNIKFSYRCFRKACYELWPTVIIVLAILPSIATVAIHVISQPYTSGSRWKPSSLRSERNFQLLLLLLLLLTFSPAAIMSPSLFFPLDPRRRGHFLSATYTGNIYVRPASLRQF